MRLFVAVLLGIPTPREKKLLTSPIQISVAFLNAILLLKKYFKDYATLIEQCSLGASLGMQKF